jgi:hypothetical protein
LEVLENRGEKRDFGEAEARELAGWGGDRKSPQAKKDQVIHGSFDRTPAAELPRKERTLRRLRRDDPDLAARVERGELTANATAVAKGWRKKREPDPFDELCKWWDLADEAVRARFETYQQLGHGRKLGAHSSSQLVRGDRV